MYNILTLNKIAKIGLNRLGDNYAVSDNCAAPEGVIVRSAAMHDMELPESLLAIARAGAGTNNIPIDKCTDKGIVVFNTPGANANAVKELVLTGMLMCSRNVLGGIEWEKSLKGNGDQVGKMVEKGKSQFVGPEIMGKTLGVIGLGAIGALVANAAQALGMNVIGYDPFLTPAAAARLNDGIKTTDKLDDIYAASDYVTVHVPLTPDTKALINAESLAKMKDGVRILNFSRDGLVNSADILAGIKSGKIAAYVTDFATDDLLCEQGVIAIPHLGASTPESEDNCAIMAADQVKAYIETGAIINSVNMPRVELAKAEGTRVAVIHKNDEAVTNAVKAVLANANTWVRGNVAYTVADTDADAASLESVDGVMRVRVIK
ncbi:MAG: 3-phosphoglycerate dehydrogenase family protein [Acutalibacteraceae bacterium]|nr:3-phosphoglycerate dehydrogenase family protein [Acutalibacteraceae bacterium]